MHVYVCVGTRMLTMHMCRYVSIYIYMYICVCLSRATQISLCAWDVKELSQAAFGCRQTAAMRQALRTESTTTTRQDTNSGKWGGQWMTSLNVVNKNVSFSTILFALGGACACKWKNHNYNEYIRTKAMCVAKIAVSDWRSTGRRKKLWSFHFRAFFIPLTVYMVLSLPRTLRSKRRTPYKIYKTFSP